MLTLWNAGLDGTGQTITVVSESSIQVSDVEAFRSTFGLPANDPQIILDGPDPGLTDAEMEADIDVEWSGAVARNATIDFGKPEALDRRRHVGRLKTRRGSVTALPPLAYPSSFRGPCRRRRST